MHFNYIRFEKNVSDKGMTIKIGHSPDPDDAFMFYALTNGQIDTQERTYEHVLVDIDTLNDAAQEGTFEVSAVSIHTFPKISDTYALMNCGASMGEGYGPILVSNKEISLEEVKNCEIAIPGIEFPTFRLSIILTGLILAFVLYFIITHTKMGMLIRAGASNRQMVSAHGIDIKSLFTVVFAVGAAMAGFAGMMISPITEASIGMGNEIIIVAFVVIIIGGIGSIKGAFLAAILVGLIDTMGRSFLDTLLKLILSAENAETAAPALSAMAIYILMAAILAVRPQGLFPPKGR